MNATDRAAEQQTLLAIQRLTSRLTVLAPGARGWRDGPLPAVSLVVSSYVCMWGVRRMSPCLWQGLYSHRIRRAPSGSQPCRPLSSGCAENTQFCARRTLAADPVSVCSSLSFISLYCGALYWRHTVLDFMSFHHSPSTLFSFFFETGSD